MQKKIHPKMNPVVFVDGKHEIVSMSTQTSDKTKTIDGVDHYIIPIEVSSFSHPLYTGEKRLLDTQGQVTKFKKKAEQAKELRKKIADRRKKRTEKQQEQSKSLKDLLETI